MRFPVRAWSQPIVQRHRLDGRMSQRPVQVQRRLRRAERLAKLAALLVQHAEVAAQSGLAGRVAKLAVQFERMAQVVERVVEFAQLNAGSADVPVCPRLGGDVAEPGGGGQRRSLAVSPVEPVTGAVEEVRHRPGELPAVGVESGAGGVADRSHYHPMLGDQPRRRLPFPRDRLRRGTCRWRPDV